MNSKYRFRRPNWRDNEISVFLKSWKDHAHMNAVFKKGCSRTPLYSAIVKDLQKEGFNRSMSEILGKMRAMTRLFRRTERGGGSDFRWFNEVREILKIEKAARKGRRVSAPLVAQDLEQLYRPYIEGNVTEIDQVVTTNVLDDDSDSDSISDNKSYTVADHVEPEEPNTYYMSIPQSSSSDSQKITENVLLDILREFQESNRELEANDAIILGLFKEQNDIFRAQTTLLTKLLLK